METREYRVCMRRADGTWFPALYMPPQYNTVPLVEALRGLLDMAEDLAATFPIKATADGVAVVERARAALRAINSPQVVGAQDLGSAEK